MSTPETMSEMRERLLNEVHERCEYDIRGNKLEVTDPEGLPGKDFDLYAARCRGANMGFDAAWDACQKLMEQRAEKILEAVIRQYGEEFEEMDHIPVCRALKEWKSGAESDAKEKV